MSFNNSKFILFLIIFILFLFNFKLFSRNLADSEVNKIVDSIYLIEGGAKTKYKYGIKSIKTDNPRKICENTVRNNVKRYQNQKIYTNYFQFLGSRYCPTINDKTGLNKNWVNNLENKLGKDFVNKVNKELTNY